MFINKTVPSDKLVGDNKLYPLEIEQKWLLEPTCKNEILVLLTGKSVLYKEPRTVEYAVTLLVNVK